jgi:3-hydroxyisobutyrate dehydrogenase
MELDLDNIISELWKYLEEGAANSRDEFHLGVFGTANHATPNLRTVVLRRVMRKQHLILFHTDSRSAKVEEIKLNPIVFWLFYSKEKKMQLRIKGKAELHFDDELQQEQWESSRLISRKCYLTDSAPGSAVDRPFTGLPEHLNVSTPTPEESEAGKKNFIVVSTEISSIEMLYLKATGHIRVKFTRSGDEYSGEWLIP